MSLQHVRIVPGYETLLYSHSHEQVGYVVSGEFLFELETVDDFVATGGDINALASEEPHAVGNTSDEPATAIDCFSPPRADPDWLE